ncbi:hypothetical protein D3C86_965110 [compost metagenome]
MAQKSRRQVARIGRRRQPRLDHPRLGQQPPQRRDRPRRRGDRQLGIIPQPQPEPQVRQRRLRVSPRTELVGPGPMKLRPSQAIRVLRRKGIGRRAAGPDQPAPPRLPARPVVPRRLRLQSRRSLDHDLAHVVQRRPDQSKGQVLLPRQLVHPEAPGEGLARPPPAQQHPGAPVPVTRPELILAQLRRRPDPGPQRPDLLLARQALDPVPQQGTCVRTLRQDDRHGRRIRPGARPVRRR